MDTLLYFDEAGYEAARDRIEKIGATSIQNIVDQYQTLGIADLQPEELSKLFKTPDDLVFDKITGGQLVIGGAVLNKSKAMEIIEKPQGYDAFIALIKTTMQDLKDNLLPPGNYPVNEYNVDTYFELDNNLEVSVKSELDTKLQKSFKRYAKSVQAKKMLELAQAIIAKYDELGIKDIIASNSNSIGSIINEVVNRSTYGNTVSLNYQGVLKYN